MLTSAYLFQRRMDLRQQSVGDPDGLAGHTVGEAHDHLQLSDRPVLAVDGPRVCGIAWAASAMMNACFATVLARPGSGRRSGAMSGRAGRRPGSPRPERLPTVGHRSRPAGQRRPAPFRAWPAVSRTARGARFQRCAGACRRPSGPSATLSSGLAKAPNCHIHAPESFRLG